MACDIKLAGALYSMFCAEASKRSWARGVFRNNSWGPKSVLWRIDHHSQTFFQLSPMSKVKFGLLRGNHGPMAPPLPWTSQNEYGMFQTPSLIISSFRGVAKGGDMGVRTPPLAQIFW